MINALRMGIQTMTNVKIMERISNLIDKMDYKTAYIEIQTDREKITLEQEKRNQIGFRSNVNEN